MRAKFIYEDIKDIFKAKKLTPKQLEQYRKTFEYWIQEFIKQIYILEPDIDSFFYSEFEMTAEEFFRFFPQEHEIFMYDLKKLYNKKITPNKAAHFINKILNEYI
jgi:hypothetical protein